MLYFDPNKLQNVVFVKNGQFFYFLCIFIKNIKLNKQKKLSNVFIFKGGTI